MLVVTRRPGFPLAVLAFALLAASGIRAAERGADGHFETRRSNHFQLFQDVAIDAYTGARGSRRFEHDVLEALEGAWRDVSDVLAIAPRGRTRVVVYDAGVYDAEFARRFGFRSAGFFDGIVHVRSGVSVDAPLAATLRHEYVHAATAHLELPAWLSEGLAEYFENEGQRGPSAGELGLLRRVVAAGYWIPIEDLSGSSFAGFGQDQATLAYLESLALVWELAQRRGERALGRLCRDLRRMRLERALSRQFGLSSAELEQALIARLR
jgi:hypothetical protein